jgi:hypothetical protein
MMFFSPSHLSISTIRVGLVQLVRFLVVELTLSYLNLRFDMSVTFIANYSFSGRLDSKTLLVTNFVNLNIKSAQSFKCVHTGRMCICVFIEVNTRTCMNICFYTVFLKKDCNAHACLLINGSKTKPFANTTHTTAYTVGPKPNQLN